jgi:hypothetical protein
VGSVGRSWAEMVKASEMHDWPGQPALSGRASVRQRTAIQRLDLLAPRTLRVAMDRARLPRRRDCGSELLDMLRAMQHSEALPAPRQNRLVDFQWR